MVLAGERPVAVQTQLSTCSLLPQCAERRPCRVRTWICGQLEPTRDPAGHRSRGHLVPLLCLVGLSTWGRNRAGSRARRRGRPWRSRRRRRRRRSRISSERGCGEQAVPGEPRGAGVTGSLVLSSQLSEEALLGNRLDSHDWEKISNVNVRRGRAEPEWPSPLSCWPGCGWGWARSASGSEATSWPPDPL